MRQCPDCLGSGMEENENDPLNPQECSRCEGQGEIPEEEVDLDDA